MSFPEDLRLDLSPVLTAHQVLALDRLTVGVIHHRKDQLLNAWMAETGLPPSQCCTVEWTIENTVTRRISIEAKADMDLHANARLLLDAASEYHRLCRRIMDGLPVTAEQAKAIAASYLKLGQVITSCLTKGVPDGSP